MSNKNNLESLSLKWSENFEIGFYIIDKQHKKLFEIYNNLVELFYESSNCTSIHDVLSQLVEYTELHFAWEERLMQKLQYSEQVKHGQMHKNLIVEITSFQHELAHDAPVLTYEILMFVKKWLFDHILSEDMKLKPLIKENDDYLSKL